MSRRCSLTGKGNLVGNTVSHSNRHVKRVQRANVHSKRLFIPSKNRWVRLKLSMAALRTIEKVGIDEYLRRTGTKV